INMVFQTVGMLSTFALHNDSIKDVVLIGALATLPHAQSILRGIEDLSDVSFIVPPDAEFGTAIGAALPYIGADC
ncbi:MAG: pantothenate kinase, partial [Clostridia bacterium]|nr:pantothenate kinase [Clostridia bacterium]